MEFRYMRIPAFEVRNKRSVTLAKCEQPPKLMIIAGPNGAGKSTLLYELRNINGRQNILYVGPHRSSRRQHVQQRHLISTTFDFEKLLCQDQAPQYEGIQMFQGTRDPWNADDSGNYLKHSLCQIEIERQQSIAARFDRDREIIKDSLVDPWEPLRTLTNSLLPHLRFVRIDNSNRDQIRCVWSVHSKNVEVDIDDLSSGEKSIIQMFYPLLEHQVRGLLAQIKSGLAEAERPETCVLIDEPELHLHPNLQVKVFDYLRILTSSGKTQVIIVTHSPTIVEHASFEELFLLRPVELVPPGENQLIQIASDEDRLKLLRDVFGTTSNVTAMQPIVIIEGELQTGASAVTSDRKLYRALNRGFDAVTLLPGGGKSECLKLLKVLNKILPSISGNLEAVALLDRDMGLESNEQNIYLLPVSMIENFLLDPLPLWEAIQSVVEKTGFSTIEDLTAALDAVLGELEADEIERRIKSKLGIDYFRPESPVIRASEQALDASKTLVEKYSSAKIAALHATVKHSVTQIGEDKKRREQFHGKNVLDTFYKKHLHVTGMAKNVFKFEAARHARERKAVQLFFQDFFDRLLKKEIAAITVPEATKVK